MVRGFEPIAGADARVLILGTAPSVRSLELQQYYGHPRNAFWPIMCALFAGGEELDYSGQVDLLVSARVALWDVLRAAERPGSLDSSIAAASAVPNDIGRFLAGHPDVAHIFFNGAAAQALFERHLSSLQATEPALVFRRLPSTSPANAGVSFEAKLRAWGAVKEAALGSRQTHGTEPS